MCGTPIPCHTARTLHHARALEGVAKSQLPLKAVVSKVKIAFKGALNEFTPSNTLAWQVCRVTLGCSRVHSGKGDFRPNGDQRELCDVPGAEPEVPYHSLVARKATTKRRFDEYIIFHRSVPTSTSTGSFLPLGASIATGPFLPFSDEDCCALLPAVEMPRDAFTSSHASRRTLREGSRRTLREGSRRTLRAHTPYASGSDSSSTRWQLESELDIPEFSGPLFHADSGVRRQ